MKDYPDRHPHNNNDYLQLVGHWDLHNKYTHCFQPHHKKQYLPAGKTHRLEFQNPINIHFLIPSCIFHNHLIPPPQDSAFVFASLALAESMAVFQDSTWSPQ